MYCEAKSDRYKYETFIRLLFKKSFTEVPKRVSEAKTIEKDTYGWSHIGYSRNKENFVDGPAVRTFSSYFYRIDEPFAEPFELYYTPNTFSSRLYRDNKRLRWLNAIVIDIDNKEIDVLDILWNVAEIGLPGATAINRTPNGWHVYWVFDERVPASDKAKTLVNMITRKIVGKLGADYNAIGCERYFRVPTNLYYFMEENTYSLQLFKDWFNEEKEDENAVNTNRLRVIKRGLLRSEPIKILMRGVEKGYRNKTLYSLAKVYQHEGYLIEVAIDELNEWNNRNTSPLGYAELIRTIKSAYGNNFSIPTKWISVLTGMNFTAYSLWYKHRKERCDRVRSHYIEWADDLLNLLNENEGYFEGSQKQLAAALNAPLRSIKQVLKLIKEGIIKSNIEISIVGKGRRARTILKLIIPKPININNYRSQKYYGPLRRNGYSKVGKLSKVIGRYMDKLDTTNRGSP